MTYATYAMIFGAAWALTFRYYAVKWLRERRMKRLRAWRKTMAYVGPDRIELIPPVYKDPQERPE